MLSGIELYPRWMPLAQHSVAMLEQCCNYSTQCRNNDATLFCTKLTGS